MTIEHILNCAIAHGDSHRMLPRQNKPLLKGIVTACAVLALGVGCSSLGSVPKLGGGSAKQPAGVSGPSDTGTVAVADTGTVAVADTDTVVVADTDTVVVADSERATVARSHAETQRKIESDLSALLGNEARFSAASAQGKPSPLCGWEGKTAMGVWVIEKRTAYCFLFDELKLNSYERSPFVSIREFIDKKTLEEVVAFEEPNNGQAFSYHFKDHNKTVVAVRLTPEPMMIRVPRKQPDKLVELGRIWAYPAKYLELEKAEVDVLAASLKEAKAKDLTAMHAEAMTDLMASMSTLAADFHAEAAAEAKSVAIPKAVKISEQAEAVAALRAYLEVGNDRGIEAGAIKYMRPTSQWVVSKSPIGLIMHRTADITVGFARTGADDVMPYSECGFVTFEVQQNYDGKGYEKQITATGMATGVKAVPCSRLR